MSNLLLRLHKWAEHQDENFLTEAFAHLLQHLWEHERRVAIALMDFITGQRLGDLSQDAETMSIATQVTIPEGRLDLTIRGRDRVAVVEVKAESPVGQDQLGRYRRALERENAEKKALVLLSRHPADSELVRGGPDVQIRWFEVAERLPETGYDHKVSEFLVRQFRGFLKERNMTIERVGWELTSGIKALQNLLRMISEGLSANEQKPRVSSGGAWSGFTIRNGQAWVGVNLDRPGVIDFVTFHLKFDRAAAEKAGFVVSKVSGRLRGSITLDLDDEKVHFFALSRENQMRAVEKLLVESLRALDQISN